MARVNSHTTMQRGGAVCADLRRLLAAATMTPHKTFGCISVTVRLFRKWHGVANDVRIYPQLFDLKRDPSERFDLSQERPAARRGSRP